MAHSLCKPYHGIEGIKAITTFMITIYGSLYSPSASNLGQRQDCHSCAEGGNGHAEHMLQRLRSRYAVAGSSVDRTPLLKRKASELVKQRFEKSI